MHFDQRLRHLPACVASHSLETLHDALPPPVPDTPENRGARDERAADAFVALQPSDAFEAMLAVQIVLQEAHAADCLRLAAQHGADPAIARRHRALAGTMTKLMRSGLRILRSRQGARPAKEETERRRMAPEVDLRTIEISPTVH